MILDYEKLEKEIANWIKDYLKTHGKSGVFFDFNRNPFDITIFTTLCKKYNIKYTNIDFCLNDKGSHYWLSMHWADSNNSITLDGLSKIQLSLRQYDKGLVGDLLPLADLYDSELKDFHNHLTKNTENINDYADLGLKEFEWADREEDKYGIISSDEDPTKSRYWAGYSILQKQNIASAHQREKLTRHKIIFRPICKIRDTKGIVR